jgi:sugar diacid utilization regulator
MPLINIEWLSSYSGAGESGKSTIVKQMRIIHGEGYSEKDRLEFIPCIVLNVVKSMQAILAAAQRFGIEIEAEGQVCVVAHRARETQLRLFSQLWQCMRPLRFRHFHGCAAVWPSLHSVEAC